MTSTTLSKLSPARRQLVALMRHVDFGRIENLLVLKGEPVLDPAPRVVREIKLDAEPGSRPGGGSGGGGGTEDFALKHQVVAMLRRLDELGNGRVELMEVKHGLPFRMNVEGAIAAV